MKLRKIFRWFLNLGVVNTTSYPSSIQNLPPGMTADPLALFGMIGAIANLDSIDWDLAAIAGGSNTSITLTGAQFYNNVLDYSGSPGGGVTMTMPSVANILAAMPPSIPQNGYSFPWLFQNDGSGQTVTITGTTNVNVLGTATVANNTTRLFLVNVNASTGVVTMLNLGTMNL